MLPFIQTSLAELMDGTIYFLELSKKKFRFFFMSFCFGPCTFTCERILATEPSKD